MNDMSIRSGSMAQPVTPQQPVSNDNTENSPMITEGMRAKYQSINESIDSEISSTREIAKPHIEKNKAMILEGAKGLTGTALILGMGKGNFIPLLELCEQFDRVVAIDIDRTAVERALKELPPALREKVVVREDDLTGVIGQFSTLIDKLSDQYKNVDDFLKQIQLAFSQFPCKPLCLSNYGASYAISSIVLSQLVCSPIEYLISVVKNKYNQCREVVMKNDAFMIAITQLSYKIHEAHTDQIDEAIVPGGRAYLSTSVAEIYLGFKNEEIVPISQPMFMIDLNVLSKVSPHVVITKNNDWFWDEKHPEKRILHISQTPQGLMNRMMYSPGSRFLIAAQIRQKY